MELFYCFSRVNLAGLNEQKFPGAFLKSAKGGRANVIIRVQLRYGLIKGVGIHFRGCFIESAFRIGGVVLIPHT